MYIPLDKIPLSNFEINTNDDPTLSTISLTIYVAGCTRRCIGCQNKELQILTPHNHKMISLHKIKKIIEEKMCLISSVCFCGGDFLPLHYSQLEKLIKFCKSKNLKTILYTGELFENINEYLRKNIDIIVDGPYDGTKRTNKFPASSNQRCWINGKLVNVGDLEINK